MDIGAENRQGVKNMQLMISLTGWPSCSGVVSMRKLYIICEGIYQLYLSSTIEHHQYVSLIHIMAIIKYGNHLGGSVFPLTIIYSPPSVHCNKQNSPCTIL